MYAETNHPTQASKTRYLIVLTTSCMAVLLYLDRFCISMAADYIKEDLGLDQRQISWFLSAFFWSYALAQVPSGWLSDRFGARIMLTAYILSWSLFTAMIGWSNGLITLIIMRLGCGLGQAGAYPTSASLLSNWIPVRRRGLCSSLVALGGRAGGVIAPFLTGYLIATFVPIGQYSLIEPNHLMDAKTLCREIAKGSESDQQTPARQIWKQLDEPGRGLLPKLAESDEITEDSLIALCGQLNDVIRKQGLFDEEAFRAIKLPREGIRLLSRINELSQAETERINRYLIEGSFPELITKIYVNGWRPVMIIYGLSGILVAALFWTVFRNSPDEHRWCNEAERELIRRDRAAQGFADKRRFNPIPWGPLLKSRSVWLLCLSQFGTNIGWVFLVTWLPRYLLSVHEVPIIRRGFYASIPLFVGILGMLSGGIITDRLTSMLGVRWGRRVPLLIARFLGVAAYVSCPFLESTPAFIVAFCVVAFSTDMGAGATWAFNQDVGGRNVGAVLGWGNMWGNLGAAVSPPIYHLVLGESPSVSDWNIMFLVCAGAFLLSAISAIGVDAKMSLTPRETA